jgi:serine/threonine-protein kinase SRPK3
VVAPKLPVNEAIEEECTLYYNPEQFCPVFLGDVLNDRNQFATKLGYGSSSTVWLARDLNQFVPRVFRVAPAKFLSRWRWLREKYVTRKINASTHHSRENAVQAELDILMHISEANSLGTTSESPKRPLE